MTKTNKKSQHCSSSMGNVHLSVSFEVTDVKLLPEPTMMEKDYENQNVAFLSHIPGQNLW